MGEQRKHKNNSDRHMYKGIQMLKDKSSKKLTA